MRILVLSLRDLASLGPEKFVWGCCVLDKSRFVYVYGPLADYLQATRHARAGDVLHKGACDTLEEACRLAEQHAAELDRFCDGFGSVRVLPAEHYREELDRHAETDPAPRQPSPAVAVPRSRPPRLHWGARRRRP